MKKNLIIIMALCVLTIGAQAQTWVNLGSVEPKEISTTVTERNSQSIRVLFDTEGFNSESINEGNTIYQRLSIPGAGKTQAIGSPELPMFRQMVAIPECSNVSLSFQVLQEQILHNYNVYPAPDHQVITNPDSTCYVAEVFSKNALCYVDNLVSPSNNVELTETGYFRSQKYAEIQVSPIRYNPATQKLYVAKEIEVTLTLTNATGPTSANLGIFNNVAAHTMLNYESTGMTAEENDMRFGTGEANGAAASTTSTSQFNVKYNNWDGNIGFNPNVVFNVPNRFEWLPFWTMAKSGEGLTESEMLYEQALQDFEDSLYVKAKSGFLHVISNYPEDWVAISALKELLRVENCLDKDYSNLKSYYLTNETIQQHDALKQLAGFLSARCDVNMKKYEDALEWYATQLSDENLSYQDSIFHIIDVGDIYYLMGEDSVCKGNLPVWFEKHNEVLPKSIIEHEKNAKQLLSTLPFDNAFVSKQRLYGEFYSFVGWEDNSGGSGIRSVAHYTEHGKKVELPYSYLIDDPEAMGIGNDFITDVTQGVLYNKDCGAGQTNKLYRSMDYGHTWEAIDDLSGCSDEYWTFQNAPGVLLKLSHIVPGELQISYDYGSHFEVMDIPAFGGSNEAGWNVGEFFKGSYSYELSSYYLTHSMDFNQTVDTVYYSEQEFLNMRAGAKEGELYTYYPSYDDPNYYIMSYKLFFSPDYGQHQQMVMTVDSLIIGDVYVMDSWEFMVDSEPGVFYSIKRENSIVYANSGKIWIDYYRDYGDTLVTTYFHHFRPDWFDHHTPVMDCEIVSCDNSGVTLHWNEPELKPDEMLIGYQVYRGVTLVSEDLVTETCFTDNYSSGGRLNYHVLAVYSNGETSKSYNIVYCEQTDGVDENEGGKKVAVFPNPANGVVSIEGVEVDEVLVYNTLGQLVKTFQNMDEMDMSALSEGVYLLRITSTDGHVHIGKVALAK